jgi:hypothetical protein
MIDSNLPISEQFRIIAKRWVDADSAANMLEETKSAYLNQLMLAQGDMAVSKAEMIVKGSAEWKEYVSTTVTARKDANLLKVQLEYIKMKFYEWQSHNANKRAEMKL